MNETKPPPVDSELVENARRFNSKEQANQYAKQNGYERVKAFELETGEFVLRSIWFPVCFIA